MPLSRTDKLDFSVELGFITLVGGAIISELLLFFFIDAYNTSAGYLLLRILGFIGGRFPLMLLFVLFMRPCIYLIDVAPLSPRVQLLLSSLVGSAIIIGLTYYNLSVDEQPNPTGRFPLFLVYSLGYTLPLVYWNHRKDIWFNTKRRRITADDL